MLGHDKFETSFLARDLKLTATQRCRKSGAARVSRIYERRPQYGLIIISDNPFHYADDQRGHVTRLPTGTCRSMDRTGKGKWRIKKTTRREKEKGREKCTLGNNNNRERGDTGRNTELPAQHTGATRQGPRCLMFKSAITRSFGDICHCRCQPATQSI